MFRRVFLSNLFFLPGEISIGMLIGFAPGFAGPTWLPIVTVMGLGFSFNCYLAIMAGNGGGLD